MDKIINYERNNSINRNENTNKYYYFKSNKRFSTQKYLRLNLLLLNNKSINFTNKNSLFHKSLQLLAQKNSEVIKNLKNDKEISNEIKAHSKNDAINNNLNKNKDNYMLQRDNYYKKNLTRIKFFYGLGKK